MRQRNKKGWITTTKSMDLCLQGLLHLYEANEIADYIQEFIDQLNASGRDKAKTWGTTLQDLNEEFKRLTRSSSTTTRRVKLPELKLTPFNGNPLDWPSLWEEFSSAVDNVPELPESGKLSYLRSALKDETAVKIASPSTGYMASYGFVLEKLKKQYERKPLIHRKHMQSLATLSKFSSSTYKGLLDMRIEIDKHIAGLKRLEQFNIEHLLASLIVNQFEPKLLDRWQAYSSEHNKELIIADVLEFMDITLSSWMHTDESVSKTSCKSTKQVQKKPSKAPVYASRNCEACGSTYHPPYLCSVFRNMPMEQRQAHVQKHKLCRASDMDICSSSAEVPIAEKKCGRKHHTLHCFIEMIYQQLQLVHQLTTLQRLPAKTCSHLFSQPTMLFMTCQIKVQTPNGHTAMARALLDTGSSTSFITAKLSNVLQAKKVPSVARIAGIQGAEAPSSSYRTTVQLVPLVKKADGITLTPAIVDKTTVDLPTQPAVTNDILILKTLQLADPQFDCPGKIDMLIGMDVYQSVVYPEILKVSSSITAQYSIFGLAKLTVK